MTRPIRTAALAATAASLLWSGAAAQEEPAQQETAPAGANAADVPAEADPVVATVDGVEITSGDVMAAIEAFPPQIQRQPLQMLVPYAIDQLVLRELILRAAREEGLVEDPEVQALVAQAGEQATEDALLQVYVDRALAREASNEAVQRVYDQLQENSETELPPLEDIRPQIVQQLQQQALADLREQLEQGVSVVFYGPDGEPTTATMEPAELGETEEPAAGENAAEPAETQEPPAEESGAEPAGNDGPDDEAGTQ